MEMSNNDRAMMNLINEILSTPKPKGGNYCVINAVDGTVTELENSYVVNLTTMPADAKAIWEEWCESGDDSCVKELAVKYGVALAEIVTLPEEEA